MQIHITSEPCLLLETIELLFGFTNHVSSQELTAAGRWCIPAEAMQTMLDTACEGLSPENPELQFFFARKALDRDPPGCTCIAGNGDNALSLRNGLSRMEGEREKRPVRVYG